MSRAEAAVRRITQEWVLACNTKHLDDLLELYIADALVLRPLPVPRAGEVVTLSGTAPDIPGFSYGSLINPMNGESSAVISRFYSLLGTMIFLIIGGDAWTLRGLSRTFQLVPLTDAPRLSSLVGGVEEVFGTVFTAALEIAAPVMAALLITDVAFGIVSRVVPQINVFAVGFPTKVAVALLVVSASLPFVANWISSQLSVSVSAALGTLHVG